MVIQPMAQRRYFKNIGVNAINKGMEIATGDVVAYLCADDTYEKDCFLNVVWWFGVVSQLQWAYGKGKIIDKNDEETRSLITKLKELIQPFHSKVALQCVDYIVQPTVFMRKSFFNKVGEFNTELKYCMDYEYWLRAAKLSRPSYIPNHIANWRAHGESLSVREYGKQAKESFGIQKKYSSKWLRLIQWKVKVLTNMLYKVVK
jgi:glycosyltransferase involved in cell wall biosynthesis